MPIIKNVTASNSQHEKAAYAAQANYQSATGTITFTEGVVISIPLVKMAQYTIDSKDLQDPVSTDYQGTNPAGNKSSL